MFIISKHAQERYQQRFGVQTLKEIARRCDLATVINTNRHGISYRKWGAIIFVATEDTVMTIIKESEMKSYKHSRNK